MSQTRLLAAILAANVDGYSRLMGADEEGTHERIKAHLQELVEPKIAKHRGRAVKNTGEGMLVGFSNVGRCAPPQVRDARGKRRGAMLKGKRHDLWRSSSTSYLR